MDIEGGQADGQVCMGARGTSSSQLFAWVGRQWSPPEEAEENWDPPQEVEENWGPPEVEEKAPGRMIIQPIWTVSVG